MAENDLTFQKRSRRGGKTAGGSKAADSFREGKEEEFSLSIEDSEDKGDLVKPTAEFPPMKPSKAISPRPAGEKYGPPPEFPEDPGIIEELKAVAEAVESCRRCPLGNQRKVAVPGTGPAIAGGVMLIGEAPGRWENESGIPFAGPSGELLDGLLARAGTNRNRVFLTNLLKCRPPENRDPEPTEIAACSIYLEGQIKALEPRAIISLGRYSSETMLQEKKFRDVRGKVWEKEDGTLILPVYHPAAALRQRKMRVEIINDFRTAGQLIDGQMLKTEKATERTESGKGEKQDKGQKDLFRQI